jgi:hypothetical protein
LEFEWDTNKLQSLVILSKLQSQILIILRKNFVLFLLDEVKLVSYLLWPTLREVIISESLLHGGQCRRRFEL